MEGVANSFTSCNHTYDQQGCIGVEFYAKNCSANATETHNFAVGQCVRGMNFTDPKKNGKVNSSMLKASCSSSGIATVLEYKNANNCGGKSIAHQFSSITQCSSNYPIKVFGCTARERLAHALW